MKVLILSTGTGTAGTAVVAHRIVLIRICPPDPPPYQKNTDHLYLFRCGGGRSADFAADPVTGISGSASDLGYCNSQKQCLPGTFGRHFGIFGKSLEFLTVSLY